MVQDCSKDGLRSKIILTQTKPTVTGGAGKKREGKGFSEKEIKKAELWNIKDDLVYDKRRKSCYGKNVEVLEGIKKELPDSFLMKGTEKITIPREKYEELQKRDEGLTFLTVDELTIDNCNMWEMGRMSNREMVDSVKKIGIETPLLVRPIQGGGSKYGIVTGGRRYDAAIKAGLDTVPCKIKEMDDIEAMKRSLIENYQREDCPVWMNIRHVGKMYSKIDGEHGKKIEKIAETGIDRGKTNRYLRIYDLPEEVKGLLREPKDRTQRHKEFLIRFSRRPKKILTPKRADLLTGMEKFSTEKRVEMAIFIIPMKVDIAKRFVELVEKYPDKDLEELRDRAYEEEYKTFDKSFRLDHRLNDALESACMAKQMHYQDFLKMILENYLKSEGFLD